MLFRPLPRTVRIRRGRGILQRFPPESFEDLIGPTSEQHGVGRRHARGRGLRLLVVGHDPAQVVVTPREIAVCGEPIERHDASRSSHTSSIGVVSTPSGPASTISQQDRRRLFVVGRTCSRVGASTGADAMAPESGRRAYCGVVSGATGRKSWRSRCCGGGGARRTRGSVERLTRLGTWGGLPRPFAGVHTSKRVRSVRETRSAGTQMRTHGIRIVLWVWASLV